MEKRSLSFFLLWALLITVVLAVSPKVYVFVLEKLAAIGHVPSFRRLGDCYYRGEWVPRSLKTAEQWYLKAAEEGDVKSFARLARLYSHNIRIEKDFEKVPGFWDEIPLDFKRAIDWHTKAAYRGYAPSMTRLGYFNVMGIGTPCNYQQAFKWYTKAAEQGSSPAKTWLGHLYSHKVGFYERNSFENYEGIEKNYEKAVEWYEKAAVDGDCIDQFRLGFLYSHGYGWVQNWTDMFAGAEKNIPFVIERYNKLYLLDCREALFNAEQEFMEGDAERNQQFSGFEKDYVKAVEWYERAAEKGHKNAQRLLGCLYHDGKGVKQDFKKAFEWWMKAADQGDYIAQCRVGHCYEYGEGVEQSYDQALAWYTKFAAAVVEEMYDDLEKNNVSQEKIEEIRERMLNQMVELTLLTMGQGLPLAAARALAAPYVPRKLKDS